MIVSCESCGTKFRFDPARMRGSRTKVRCSRCGHVFVLSRPEEEEFVHVDLSDENLFDDDSGDYSQDITISPPITRTGKKRSFKVPAAILLVLLIFGLGIYWLIEHSESILPPATNHQVKQASGGEGQPPTITILDSTQAYFLENSLSGQIFVVEGEVANESDRPVSFILLEGKLYTKNNQIAQSQRCFSGNPINRDELIKLDINNLQNRMMNREGKDLMNVNIPASKRVPFMLIFHNLPELDALGDYSIEVISAQ
ncbi:MAG: DUF3426 domain-containing protein [Syntrophobacteraceae bacterium]